ncbi:hypothetical protein [Piscinibacter koreensis]|uniref:Mercuric ion transport protein n=1 Tax=Piscinibacter koreensis TaxID=2742824 RepID=A0A7Y6NT68_9BURK|nr:hypothetical protein [Schlegelella koreensis]NUZ08891.1 hypothetical protein [Schlegelella koreensis]
MNKKVLGAAGLVAACGVCCAFPLALPLLGGLAASGLGFALGWQGVTLAATGLVVAPGVFALRRQSQKAACAPAAPELAGCGCGSSCASMKGGAS